MQDGLFEPGGPEAGRASFYLVVSLLNQLIESGVFSTDQANFAAAMAAFMARGNGHEEAARLIEQTIESSREVDFEQEAERMGLNISKAKVQ